MDLYHWPSPEGNFGDDLNLWLWEFLLPGYQELKSDDLLVGVGTVLDTALLPADRKKLVIGSGTGYGSKPDVKDASLWDIRCVRGPLTAAALGLEPNKGILDPAAVIPDMGAFQELKMQQRTIFVPHWQSALYGQWESVCEHAGVTYVDSCKDAHEVISIIAQSTLVIAESMHAAILADAFRVPWIPVVTSKQINAFKWRDWASSLEMDYQPHILQLSSPLEAGAKGQPYLGLRWPGRGHESGAMLAHAKPDLPVATHASISEPQALDKPALKDRVKGLLSTPIMSRGLMIPSIRDLKKAAKAAPRLSKEHVYTRQKSRFYETVTQVRSDYGL